MSNNQAVDTHKVFVELSVVPLGSNGRSHEQITGVQVIVENTGLFHERTSSGTYLEGDWSDICSLLHTCYEKVQEHSPHSYLKVAIR